MLILYHIVTQALNRTRVLSYIYFTTRLTYFPDHSLSCNNNIFIIYFMNMTFRGKIIFQALSDEIR